MYDSMGQEFQVTEIQSVINPNYDDPARRRDRSAGVAAEPQSNLTFELRLPTVDEATGEESYEVLFTTGLIPPGQYCNKVTLNRALEPGEYKVIVHVQPYTIDTQMPTNNADMETVLIVE